MTIDTEVPTLKIAFSREDAERAYAEWNCNCGPGALAACIGWSLDAIRSHMGGFEAKGYTNPTLMQHAIRSTGHRYFRAGGKVPLHGLVRVQWHGPWMLPGVPIAARYRQTHWVASKVAKDNAAWVFDINGGWLPIDRWEAEIVPLLVAATPRADGEFSFTDCWEVRKARAENP